MSFHALDDFQSRRPGFRTRPLIGTKHGFTSFFVSEFLAAEGAAIPLHTHPIEEAIVVTEGALTVQLGAETLTVPAGSVVRVPPGVPMPSTTTHRRRRVASARRRITCRRSSRTRPSTWKGGLRQTYLKGETPG